MFDLLLTGGTVVDPVNGAFRGDIGIKDGLIAGILVPGSGAAAKEIVSVEGRHVFPGGLDPHTHLGYANPFAQDVNTETVSAALGGVTTVLSFHRHYQNAIPTPYDDYPDLVSMVEEQAHVDIGLHFGILTEAQADELDRYIDLGISSFKFYMAYRGADGKTVGMINEIDDGVMFDSFKKLGHHDHAVACVHCENTDIIGRYAKRVKESGMDGLAAWNAARPAFAEAEHVRRAGYFAEQAGCSLYYVHIGAKEGLQEALIQKQRYGRITVETCTHYLTLTEDSDVGTLGKVNPPLRKQEDLERIWEGVISGEISCVGTDHCAVCRAQKQGTIWQAASGFPGMATIFPVMLTEGYHKRGMSLQRIAQVTSYNAAKTFNLYPRKGTFQIGADADLAVVDIEKERVVDASVLGSASDFSLYEGKTLKGWPVMTFLGGKLIARDGKALGARGNGSFLKR